MKVFGAIFCCCCYSSVYSSSSSLARLNWTRLERNDTISNSTGIVEKFTCATCVPTDAHSFTFEHKLYACWQNINTNHSSASSTMLLECLCVWCALWWGNAFRYECLGKKDSFRLVAVNTNLYSGRRMCVWQREIESNGAMYSESYRRSVCRYHSDIHN